MLAVSAKASQPFKSDVRSRTLHSQLNGWLPCVATRFTAAEHVSTFLSLTFL